MGGHCMDGWIGGVVREQRDLVSCAFHALVIIPFALHHAACMSVHCT